MTHQRFDTLAIHEGYSGDPVTGSRAVPIYQTSSYLFKDAEYAANLFKMEETGYIYSRNVNPTVEIFEKRVAALEGGTAAFAVSSGQAAVTLAILTVAQSGDEIVSTNALYGGTYALFVKTLKRFGVTVRFVDGTKPEDIRAAINEKTRAIFTETIGNPSLEIADFETLSAIAREAHIPLLVDNTFASPYLANPFKFGANIVIHSATKFIGGHGTSLGGVIIDGGNFDWTKGNFPEFTEKIESLNNRSYVEIAGDKAFVTKTRYELGHDFGATLSPFNAWLFIQGLETLSLRVEKHVSNAQKVVDYLRKSELVEWVNYPSVDNPRQYELAQKYLAKGAGSIFAFGIKGGLEAAKQFIEEVQLLSHVANVGDARTLVIHPASTSHARLNEQQLKESGVSPELVRLSIGLEDADDIIADIEQALQKVKRVQHV